MESPSSSALHRRFGRCFVLRGQRFPRRLTSDSASRTSSQQMRTCRSGRRLNRNQRGGHRSTHTNAGCGPGFGQATCPRPGRAEGRSGR
eukprot:scaffold1875_cov253-Pinguiococcus_pyrenoidosus.AAC.4